MANIYTFENVAYRNAGRRWDFTAPNYSFTTTAMPGGRQTADKAARIINGAIVRTKGAGIDGLARSNMADLFHRAHRKESNLVIH
jgi:hypothetical protein